MISWILSKVIEGFSKISKPMTELLEKRSILDSMARKKEAGATAAVGGATWLHGGGVTGDRPKLGSGGRGITAGWPKVRGRIGELI
jgi:hypothetical protein